MCSSSYTEVHKKQQINYIFNVDKSMRIIIKHRALNVFMSISGPRGRESCNSLRMCGAWAATVVFLVAVTAADVTTDVAALTTLVQEEQAATTQSMQARLTASESREAGLQTEVSALTDLLPDRSAQRPDTARHSGPRLATQAHDADVSAQRPDTAGHSGPRR